MATLAYTELWVCLCCMLMHANGECCEGTHDPANGPEPWSLWADTPGHSAMGGEHVKGCPNGPDGKTRGETDCDCETREFSRSSCDGCGSTLYGVRHAFVWFHN